MILGEKKLLDSLGKLSQTDLYGAVARGIKTVQAEAKSLSPVHDGELRDSIYTSVETSDGNIVGTCYTNKSYAAYVEFGTGPKGQANHEGISPDAAVSYSQSPWWIHESQVGRETAERYGWPCIDTPDGRFYRCSGQAAQPYMYPALKNNEQEIERIFEEAVKKKK